MFDFFISSCCLVCNLLRLICDKKLLGFLFVLWFFDFCDKNYLRGSFEVFRWKLKFRGEFQKIKVIREKFRIISMKFKVHFKFNFVYSLSIPQKFSKYTPIFFFNLQVQFKSEISTNHQCRKFSKIEIQIIQFMVSLISSIWTSKNLMVKFLLKISQQKSRSFKTEIILNWHV